ncbi:MAG: hypothetical protein K1X79_00285 [Oligoflexia bacterium]|nr:hypothetical protein [Oligoflexia bacterium]
MTDIEGRMRYVFFLVTALISFAGQALAEPVTATLAVDHASVEAGKKFSAGILFKLEPGWHIYWKDPGDSGLPTKLKFELPAGFQVSEIRWPKHEEFVMPGNIKINGYEHEVLLWSEIQVPSDASGAVNFTLKGSWLNCSASVCVPEKKTFQHSVAIGKDSGSSDMALFTTWAAKVPTE